MAEVPSILSIISNAPPMYCVFRSGDMTRRVLHPLQCASYVLCLQFVVQGVLYDHLVAALGLWFDADPLL